MLNYVATNLESIQMSNAQSKHVLHANVIAQGSHNNQFNQLQPKNAHGNTLYQLLPLWWISVPHCHWLLLEDANPSQNPCIPMQCFKDNIYHVEIICITWSSRIPGAHRLQMHYLLNLPQIGNAITTQAYPGIPAVLFDVLK